MVTNSIEYTIKSEHVIVADPGIISFDRREKMKIRPFAEFLDDTDRREAFVCDDDTALDVIVKDKRAVRNCINTVARKHLRTDRFHGFNVIGIDYGDIPAAFAYV